MMPSMLAVGGEDVDAAGAGRPEVARGVHLHAVGKARLALPSPASVTSANTRPGADRAVGLHRICHPDRLFRVRLRDVERLLVRREGEAVRRVQLLRQQGERAVGAEAVHALEGEFLLRIVPAIRQAVRRIGEVQRAGGVVDEVVRAVQTLAVVLVREARDLPVRLQARDAAVCRAGTSRAGPA